MFENVQTFHFLMKTFSFEFKEALLKCIGVELASHIFSASSCLKCHFLMNSVSLKNDILK